MLTIQILGISAIVVLVATIVLLRKQRNKSPSNADMARQRAAERTSTGCDNFAIESGGVIVHDFDLTPEQFALCDLIQQGFIPDVTHDSYKYKGTPRNRIAGVPESYGAWNE